MLGKEKTQKRLFEVNLVSFSMGSALSHVVWTWLDKVCGKGPGPGDICMCMAAALHLD